MTKVGYKLTTKAHYSLYAKGKYKLRYLPNTTVTADPNTLGLMMFPKLSDALAFVGHCNKRKQNIALLEIEYSYCNIIQYMASPYSEHSLNQYYDPNVFIPRLPSPHPGTAVCASAKVLRQIPFP